MPNVITEANHPQDLQFVSWKPTRASDVNSNPS